MQFLCLPLPGGVALTAAALLAVQGRLDPWLICACVVLGVLAGSLAGYRIGARGDRPLLERLGRRFPRVLATRNLTRAETAFARWGVLLLLASVPAWFRHPAENT